MIAGSGRRSAGLLWAATCCVFSRRWPAAAEAPGWQDYDGARVAGRGRAATGGSGRGRIYSVGTDSCWAFTAVATVEGINAIVTGNLVSLSEQEIVDCDLHGTHCQAGWIWKAYDYIQRNGGIDTDANYPYTASHNRCKPCRNKVVTIDGYAPAPENDENILGFLVARRPVGALLDASGRDFHLYQGGVYKGECTTNVNHAVTIVGYDSEACGQAYWIIKNTYGQDRIGERKDT